MQAAMSVNKYVTESNEMLSAKTEWLTLSSTSLRVLMQLNWARICGVREQKVDFWASVDIILFLLKYHIVSK